MFWLFLLGEEGDNPEQKNGTYQRGDEVANEGLAPVDSQPGEQVATQESTYNTNQQVYQISFDNTKVVILPESTKFWYSFFLLSVALVTGI